METTDNRNKVRQEVLWKTLAHTKWRCQYHIVFAPKYRRQIIYGKYRAAIGKILRQICERCDGVEIIEASACKDHIHMLVTIPPKMSVSKFEGILKGKSSLMIFDQFANLKYKYGNRHFECRDFIFLWISWLLCTLFGTVHIVYLFYQVQSLHLSNNCYICYMKLFAGTLESKWRKNLQLK